MKGSAIEWTDHTFNAWEGCTKVSPGCANCYAEARNKRFAQGRNWGPGAPRRRTAISNWQQVLGWNKQAACGLCGEFLPIGKAVEHRHGSVIPAIRRVRVFCNSLADWLDEEVPIEWLADLLKLIHDTPNLDWLLLTKRPENWRKRLESVHAGCTPMTPFSAWLAGWLFEGHTAFSFGAKPPENVWIGTTAEDQERADLRLPKLVSIPAKLRFLSCEPLLEEIDIDHFVDPIDGGYVGKSFIDWVICGGESGPKRRAFDCEWARLLRDQCQAAGVPFFFKQVDKAEPIPPDLLVRQFPSSSKIEKPAL